MRRLACRNGGNAFDVVFVSASGWADGWLWVIAVS